MDLRSVGKQTMQLSFPQQGLHHYVPVAFQERYSCVVGITVHSVLLGFKFYPKTLEDSEEDELTKIVPLDKGKKKPQHDSPSKTSASLADWLFARPDGKLPLSVEDAKHADSLREDYAYVLVAMCCELWTEFEALKAKCASGPRLLEFAAELVFDLAPKIDSGAALPWGERGAETWQGRQQAGP